MGNNNETSAGKLISTFSHEDYEVYEKIMKDNAPYIISVSLIEIFFKMPLSLFNILTEGTGVSKQSGVNFPADKPRACLKVCVCVCCCCRQRSGVERGRGDVVQQLGDARRGLVRSVSKLLLLDPEQQRPVEAGILQEPHTRRHLQEAPR